MTRNTPPCEVCLLPLQAWQGVSLPPSPPLPHHVLAPNNIREGASRCRHEFESFAVWKRSWSHSLVLKLITTDYRKFDLIRPQTCEAQYTHKISSRSKVRGCYRAAPFPGPRRISAWHEWLSQAPLWSAADLCAGQEVEGSHTCSTNPGQNTRKPEEI